MYNTDVDRQRNQLIVINCWFDQLYYTWDEKHLGYIKHLSKFFTF